MEAQQISLFDNELVPGEYQVPTDATPTQCRSCGATDIWARTANGRTIPLAMKTARIVHGQQVAMTHFADCPHAQQWCRNGA